MKAISASFILLFVWLGSFAQLGKKLYEFEETKITTVAIDRLGEFYLQVENQSIKKYNTEGKYLATFEPQTDSVTSLHPWNPLNVFLYNRNTKTLLFLDRSLKVVQKIIIEPSLAIEPWLACAGNNNTNYWLYDKADFSLKKINLANETILSEIDLTRLYTSQVPDVVYLREYQNLLFLLDKNAGIKIISITGKLIQSLPSSGISNFSFVGEELYYFTQSKIKFYDLYTQQQHEIEVDKETKFALATDERVILVSTLGKVSVWEFKP
jgi:hypothetical protein